MSRGEQTAHHEVRFVVEIDGDLAALAAEGRQIALAALRAADDLARGRVVGKRLGARSDVGDLSGLSRVKFDVPERRRQRFRLVYRELEDGAYQVVAIARREQSTVYRITADRLGR